ncbi:MAG: hypothetical protein PVG32_08450 [Anaerolineales bacterium]|jgi:glucan phosphoethanolaminetransferase (alkaline phosphatase superfamily)
MEEEILKTNILSITVSGLLILLTGALFLIFRGTLSKNLRFFLPIPPLGVAAYIFVFNLYVYYGGNLPDNRWETAKEILYSITISSIIFGAFTVLLIVLIGSLRRFL